jgi:hypothetical protein
MVLWPLFFSHGPLEGGLRRPQSLEGLQIPRARLRDSSLLLQHFGDQSGFLFETVHDDPHFLALHLLDSRLRVEQRPGRQQVTIFCADVQNDLLFGAGQRQAFLLSPAKSDLLAVLAMKYVRH